MFSRKYVFEVKKTRYLRYFKNVLTYSCLFLIIYSLFCGIFIIVSDNENTMADQTFFKKSPDLIAVFTGDLGRIPFALKKAYEYKESKLFITGVYSKNSIKTILENYHSEYKIDAAKLEIDYLARNTVENVISTLRYLRTENSAKRILIISHDYHIMRIKLIMENLKGSHEPYDFYYLGLKTDYSNWRNLKILYTEVYKLIRTFGFLLFWNSGLDS